MKIDDRIYVLPLTPEQLYFASCWHNMVHAFSLDSYRVRVINPRNGVTELLRMMKPPANSEDLAMVASELSSILDSDPLMSQAPFSVATSQLRCLIDTPKGAEKDKLVEKNKGLVQAFAVELRSTLDRFYLLALLRRLEEILIRQGRCPPTMRERVKEINCLTGNLLSVLLDNGASIESLFQLYRQVITKQYQNKPYVFERKFALLVKLITQQPRKFEVVFALDNVTAPQDFPGEIGGIKFSMIPPGCAGSKPNVLKYASAHPHRLFATVNVETEDFRTAGSRAYSRINDILDLVRFEYERDRIHLMDEFIISDGAAGTYRVYPIPKVVPNPSISVGAAELESFVRSVNELVGNKAFAEDGRDRVQSAFRLYRVGADSNIFENKLTNWWTAIEYLVKGSSSTAGIGKAVEDAITPVICMLYIEKHLVSVVSGQNP